MAGRRKLNKTEAHGFAKPTADLAILDNMRNSVSAVGASGATDGKTTYNNNLQTSSPAAGSLVGSSRRRKKSAIVETSLHIASQAHSKNTQKSERTKQALVEAFEQLLVQVGYAKISVRAITESAKVDRQTFYYHFDTLGDLLDYACKQHLQELSEKVEASSPTEVFLSVVQQLESQREVLAALISVSGRKFISGAFYETMHASLVRYLRERADESGIFVSTGEIESAALYCQYASVHIVIDWLCGDGLTDPGLKPKDLAELLSAQLDMHATGLLARQR